MNEDIDLSKATEISRKWLKENRGINLWQHLYLLDTVKKVDDRWLVICSIQEDFGERTYYVFRIDLKGIILKVGSGYSEENTIKLKEYKLEWRKEKGNLTMMEAIREAEEAIKELKRVFCL